MAGQRGENMSRGTGSIKFRLEHVLNTGLCNFLWRQLKRHKACRDRGFFETLDDLDNQMDIFHDEFAITLLGFLRRGVAN